MKYERQERGHEAESLKLGLTCANVVTQELQFVDPRQGATSSSIDQSTTAKTIAHIVASV